MTHQPQHSDALIQLGLAALPVSLLFLALWKFGLLLGLGVVSGAFSVFFILLGLVVARRERNTGVNK